jgi:hypothetical protein
LHAVPSCFSVPVFTISAGFCDKLAADCLLCDR